MPSLDDKIEPKTLSNGVVVPPSLQVNQMTLVEWVRRAQWDEKFSKVTKDDLRLLAKRMGYSEDDIKKEI